VDHKEAGKVCVVVQDVTRFEPTDSEIEKAKAVVAQAAVEARPLRLRVDAARLPAAVIYELRDVVERYPGESDFELEMHTRAGRRLLRFGEAFKVAARNAGFNAELQRLLGPAVLAPPPAAGPEPEPAPAEPEPEPAEAEPAHAAA
jgi:DNA polymerase-3 subunit alpha